MLMGVVLFSPYSVRVRYLILRSRFGVLWWSHSHPLQFKDLNFTSITLFALLNGDDIRGEHPLYGHTQAYMTEPFSVPLSSRHRFF